MEDEKNNLTPPPPPKDPAEAWKMVSDDICRCNEQCQDFAERAEHAFLSGLSYGVARILEAAEEDEVEGTIRSLEKYVVFRSSQIIEARLIRLFRQEAAEALAKNPGSVH